MDANDIRRRELRERPPPAVVVAAFDNVAATPQNKKHGWNNQQVSLESDDTAALSNTRPNIVGPAGVNIAPKPMDDNNFAVAENDATRTVGFNMESSLVVVVVVASCLWFVKQPFLFLLLLLFETR